MAPFVIFPVASFGSIKIIDLTWKKVPITRFKEEGKKAIFAYIVLIFIVSGLPQYNAMKDRLSFQELNKEKYDALTWIQKNTHEDSKILLVDGFNIASGLYSKRITFQRDWDEYVQAIDHFNENGTLSTAFPGHWLEFLHNLPYEKSFLNYGYHPLPVLTVHANSFDYLIMWNFNERATAYNNAFSSALRLDGFNTVYEKEGIMIMEKKK